jgi:hypothetical protein
MRIFYVIHVVLVLKSLYYQTNTSTDIIYKIHINCYMFRHQDTVFRELLQHRCTNQLDNICFVLSPKRNWKVRLLKYTKFLQHKIDSNDSLQYSGVLQYIHHKSPRSWILSQSVLVLYIGFDYDPKRFRPDVPSDVSFNGRIHIASTLHGAVKHASLGTSGRNIFG